MELHNLVRYLNYLHHLVESTMIFFTVTCSITLALRETV